MRRGLPLIALGLFGLTGCGSMANTFSMKQEEGGKRIYGGVRADWEVAKDCLENKEELGLVRIPLLVQATLDIPFSLVGDTLTLPITAAATASSARSATRESDAD